MDANETNTNSAPSPQPAKPWNPALLIGAAIVVALLAFLMLRGSGGEEDMEMNMEGAIEEQEMEGAEEMDTLEPEATAPTENTQSGEGAAMVGEVKTIAIEGGSFYYKPNEIRVKEGEKVRITMTSKDMMHDFVIDELGVKMPIIRAGDSGTVEFTASKKGTFEYYCSVGQHRKNGQIGKLIVE